MPEAVASIFSIRESRQQRKAAKSASEAAASRQQAAETRLMEAQETAADQAKARVEQKKRISRTRGKTIYTSPLGLKEEATVYRKKLLGQ